MKGGGELFFYNGGFLMPARIEPGNRFLTRPSLEAAVRARVRVLPNVRFIDQFTVIQFTVIQFTVIQFTVIDLVATAGRVTGVRVEPRQPGAAEEILSSELVVDASGRGSRTPAWLEALGKLRACLAV